MVIIKATRELDSEDMEDLILELKTQQRSGIIVLPTWCDLLGVFRDGCIPEDFVWKIVQHKEDTRVAELERELAAAMAYITSAKDCDTCKHRIKTNAPCEMMDYDCDRCNCLECICKSCYGASNWEWRGASGDG